MRLVTSCPACNAAFYVAPEQLAAHRGDVQCGKCEHVFNALDRLAEIADEAEIKDSISEPVSAEQVNQAQVTQDSSAPVDIDIIAESDAPSHQEPETDEQTLPAVEQTPAAEVANTDSPAVSITDYSIPGSATILSPTMMDDAVKNKTGKSNIATSSRSGFAKFLIALMVVILVLAALAQATYYLRSDIAARWPQYRPYLEQACQLVQCKVELPKNADLIVIDDSDLQEDADRQGLIHLYSSLINTADYVQTYPLLELTLTDANDKPLLRRTFKPEEYLPPKANIKRGVFPNEEINIKLSITASGEPVAGYRLFVTY